jgi:hypothetical protein
VDKGIAKGHDLVVRANSGRDRGLVGTHAIDRLPDDLEVALDQLARATVTFEFLKRHACRVVCNVLHGIEDELQGAQAVTPHRAAAVIR